ncbi:hypothetical protein EV175_006904, partial [Coemansia sp. RSA 1933]
MTVADLGRIVVQTRSLKDAAFYPTIDVAIVLASVYVFLRSKPAAATTVRRSADPLAQCCYGMLSVLTIIQCSSWTDLHFPLSVAALPLFTAQASGYYPFQFANLFGMYRVLSGDGGVIGTDIWHRILCGSMHAYLLLANLDTQGQMIMDDLKHMLLFTQERRLLSIQ